MVEDKKYIACRQEETGWSSLSEAVGIPDSNMKDILKQAEDRATLEKILSEIRPRWRQVLKYRFLEGLTQEETGEKMGVNRARIYQIESTALRKLNFLTKNDEKKI